MRRKTLCTALMVCLFAQTAKGQTFSLRHTHDSTAVLTLGQGRNADSRQLPYHTFAFDTADVTADGRKEALVGVVKTTRFDPRPARRLFVFRDVRGRIRPLWLGSRLCGQLHDFCTEADGTVVTLERDNRGTWFVGRYRWDNFGFVLSDTDTTQAAHATADSIFNTIKRQAHTRNNPEL